MQLSSQDEVDSVVDDLKYHPFSVLDDGHVMLVDVMGGDAAICEAARVSYGAGINKRSDDVNLIRYLMRHHHTTPFEMVEFKFRVRVPMDCWRQWIRHRTANVNEYSTRYSEAIGGKQKTSISDWRSQSSANKQGSGNFLDDAQPTEAAQSWERVEAARAAAGGENPRTIGEYLSEQEARLHGKVDEVYHERLNFGVAREQSRKDLTLSNYTEAYWKMDLHNLFHFLRLRMDGHAQFEIRQYALAIGFEIVSKVVPIAWQAFLDYQFETMHLTRLDIGVIGRLTGGAERVVAELPVSEKQFLKCQDENWVSLKRCRERDECLEKLCALGIVAPDARI